MKKLSKFLSLLICIILLSSTFMSCKSNKVTLEVFNWGENIDMDLINQFEKQYGIDINYTTYDTNEDMYIVVTSQYMLERMVNESLLVILDKSNITNLDKIYKDFLDRPFDP